MPPFIVSWSIYFPFISGKTYLFRFLVELSFAFWLLLAIRDRKYWPNFKNPIVAATLLFLLGLTITALLGIDPINSFFSNIERADGVIQFGHWFLYFLMIISVFQGRSDWERLLKILVGLAAALALWAWYLDRIAAYVYRIQGSFGNPSYLGAFMIFAIGFAAALAVLQLRNNSSRSFDQDNVATSKKWLLLWLGLIIFFGITLMSTQTRGAYLGLAGGFIFFTAFAFIFLRKKHKNLSIFLGAAFISGLIVVSSIFAFQKSQLVQSQYILKRIADFSTVTQSTSFNERVRAWMVALKVFKDKPIFGWGPENFGPAFNYHYDFQATQLESWFDRPHSQPLQILAEGGLFLFLLYLFWIGAIFFVIYRIFGKNRLLGGVLAATYLAFLIQDLFLFDTYPLYLGLFPFLGFLYFGYESGKSKERAGLSTTRLGKVLGERNPATYLVLILLLAATFYLTIHTVWRPYKANSLIIDFYNYAKIGKYAEAQRFLDQATQFKSPYTWFDNRKNSGWIFLSALDRVESEGVEETAREPFINLYKFITVKLEEALAYRPVDQQIYYVLGKTYRLGVGVLGQSDDLVKAERVLQKGRGIAPDRAEYINELATVLVDQKRFDEAETLLKEQQARVGLSPVLAHAALGHLYFLEGNFSRAMEEYDEAKRLGYPFWESDQAYNRYIFVSDQFRAYEKILQVSKEFIENRGSDGDAWFNIALAFKKLGQDKDAASAFREAVKLSPQYSQYQDFFKD